MTQFVVDNPGGDAVHGVDLVDGDEPAVRMIVHGHLPTTIEREGRMWLATGDSHVEDDSVPIAIYHPAP